MSLQSILLNINALKTALDDCHPISNDRLQKINYKFRLDWNYHSNKMEGGTLTFEETRSVMMAQLEIHGKPLRDVLEMRGHDDVIKNIQKLGRGDLQLTENRIKDIHKSIIFEADDLPGQYKNRDNYIYNYAGERFDFTPKEETAAALNTLTNWLENALNALKKTKNASKRTVPDIAFEYHLRFLTIHPFLDGNGRTGRILLNLILISNGYPPVIIRTEEKEIYGKHIAHAQQYEQNTTPLYEMLGNLLVRSLETCLKGAKGDNVFELEDWEKRLEVLNNASKETEIVKSSETIEAVLNNTFLPFLTYADMKLSSFDKLFTQKSRTYTFGTVNLAIFEVADVREAIKNLHETNRVKALNQITICFDWSDFKKSQKVRNMSVNFTITFEEKTFFIQTLPAFGRLPIEKRYDEQVSNFEFQNIVNKLGENLTSEIENQWIRG